MLKIDYNKENENWYSRVTVKDVDCYFDKEGRYHRTDGPAVSPDQWLYKDVNVTYNFKQFAEENEITMNEESFKIFLFEWKLKNNLTT